ncbi:MAG: cob(I)yrinic acid a,c-diamide adenosyltransferase [Myxococcota bacterium]
MRITKVYTRTGDRGTTRLVGGEERRKDDARIEAYGTVDELNSVIGVVRSTDDPAIPAESRASLDAILGEVQDDLFNVGTDLATPAAARWDGMYQVGDRDVERLEGWIDRHNEALAPLREFVLPGGGPIGAGLHLARTVCRRAERRSLGVADEQPALIDGPIRYLNRLSDLLFVLARWAAHAGGRPEVTWRNPSHRTRPTP